MLYLTILSVCLFSVTCQAKPWFRTEDAEQHFEEFIATYNKQYKDESEKNMRSLIFKENLNTLNEMNSMGHAEYGNVEGQYAIKYDQLVDFSPQQLVDCDNNDTGCSGGLPHQAMIWLAQNGGLMTEKDYPYQAQVETCKADKSKAVAKVTGCNKYDIKNEDELKQILADVGPLAVAIDSSPFMFYTGGIIACGPDQDELSHAVLLVGYGTEGGVPYWLFKNSEGPKFGEEGYFRFKMYENSCNMTAYIVSAVVA